MSSLHLVPSPAAGVRRAEVVAALSHALDLTEGQPAGHASRTCLIGLSVALLPRLPADEMGALHYALLLKDAGCTASSARITQLRTAGQNQP